MSPRELMIYDWVYDSENECYWQHNIKDYRCENRILLSFEPIPITDEILKANGFNKVHHVGTGATEEYNDYITNGFLCCHMVDDWKDIHFSIPDTPIKFLYVHELQHALRLCGLNELADNFVIEKKKNNGND